MLKRIYNYYLTEKKLLTCFLLSSLLVTIMDLYGPLIVKKLIDTSIPQKNIKEFIAFSLFLLAIYVTRFLVSLFSASRGKLMGNKIKFLMREDLMKKVLHQQDTFFMQRQSGDLISRITNDLENVSLLLYRGLEDFILSILSIVGALVLMINFNLKLTFFIMIPLPIAACFMVYQNRKLKKGYRDIRVKISSLTSVVHSTLRTIFFIKDNSLEKNRFEKLSKDNLSLLKVEKNNIFNVAVLMSGVNLYNQLTQLIVIFAGGYMHIKGQISFGIIVSFLLLTGRFRIYLLRLMGLVDVFQRGASGMTRFFEIMNVPDGQDGTKVLESPIEKIEVKNLNFAFGNKKVLNNISVEIKKGEKVAFVGESGVGKTTMLSILKRTFESPKGTVLINGNCINDLKRKSFLDKISIVNQSDSIINDTILENIRIVKQDATQEELDRAIDRAELRETIDELDKKENTLLGEEGIELSSGQKQRIAMARVFLKNPEVVFLDEGTSALDNILEKKIMDKLLEEFDDKIIISVAHRLNTLKKFDKIIVLEKSGIVEVGTYDELVANKNTAFYKMCYV